MKKYNCQHCNKEFENYPCNIKTSKPSCSRKCAAFGTIPPSRKGKKLSEETKRKLKGRIPWNYIKDRSLLKKDDRRNDSAYKEWRKQVWLRDNFKCKIANPDCKGRIEAHHILAWSLYPELRYQINNGITLCHAHHPRKRAEEKRLSPYFMELVSVSKIQL